MRKTLLATGFALAAVLSGIWIGAESDAAPPPAPAPSAAQAPAVMMLSGPPGGDTTSLRLVTAGDATDPAPVATFRHLPGAVVRASAHPSGAALAVADTQPGRDASFNASLFKLTPGKRAVVLADRVVHASRPHVTEDGRLFVSRGRPGTASPTAMRLDKLTIDQVDPNTGTTTPLHQYVGQLLFMAGSASGELFVYRIDDQGADLVAIDVSSGAVRSIAPKVLPFARDFSVDAPNRKLIFQQRHVSDSRRWVVTRMDLDTGATESLFESASYAMVPYAWPGGSVAFNDQPKLGLAVRDAAGTSTRAGSLGTGVDVVLDAWVPKAGSAAGAYVAGLHQNPGSLPEAFVAKASTGEMWRLPVPAGERATIAGFAPAGMGKGATP